MFLIVKTSTPVPAEGSMHVHEKVAVGTTIRIGDEIFVWTAETQGGVGLSARGEVESIGSPDPDRRRALRIRLQVRQPRRPFGKADLAPHDHRTTGFRGGSVQERLTAKLYGHSLNRVVALELDEAELLRASL